MNPRDLGLKVAVGQKQVEPAIEVVVEEEETELERWLSDFRVRVR